MIVVRTGTAGVLFVCAALVMTLVECRSRDRRHLRDRKYARPEQYLLYAVCAAGEREAIAGGKEASILLQPLGKICAMPAPKAMAPAGATGPDDGVLSATREHTRQQIAAVLMKADPLLAPSLVSYRAIAAACGIERSEARLAYEHVALSEPGKPLGLQIAFCRNGAVVGIPLVAQEALADALFQRAWQHLRTLREQFGYYAYDPELEKILDLKTGYSEVRRSYIYKVADAFSPK